jgi:hypothetical protein
MITIYYNGVEDAVSHQITPEQAFERIRTGQSWNIIKKVREAATKVDQNDLKKRLPCVMFSGVFEGRRKNLLIKEHSGLICLDFDRLEGDALEAKRQELQKNEIIYAVWVSPSGNGLKALVKISDTDKHMAHFDALLTVFPDMDKMCRNVARVCYESCDSKIYVNPNSKVFTRVKVYKVPEKVTQMLIGEPTTDQERIFRNLLTWNQKSQQFMDGNRNNFLFRLACSCCRFGLPESDVAYYLTVNYLPSDPEIANDITKKAWRVAGKDFATCHFVNNRLQNKTTGHEAAQQEIPDEIDLEEKIKDVIYAEDVIEDAVNIWRNGFESVSGIQVPEVDEHFKLKMKELTLLSGYANYGKSQFLKWYMLMQVILYKRKFALFPPEDCPAEEFYHHLAEMLIGKICTPNVPNGPTEDEYRAAIMFLNKYIFFVYPKEAMPTPDHIKGIFLQVVMKEKVCACIIDPYNQLAHQYSGDQDHRYLEGFLGNMTRFAQDNNISVIIVAHPTKPQKNGRKNFPCPDHYSITGGSMWANKMDNILIYHRPLHQEEPNSTLCEFHAKKIKRQHIVGKLGYSEFHYHNTKRRYIFDGERDPMADAMKLRGISFKFEHEDFDVSIPEQKVSAMDAVSAIERTLNFESQQSFIPEQNIPAQTKIVWGTVDGTEGF